MGNVAGVERSDLAALRSNQRDGLPVVTHELHFISRAVAVDEDHCADIAE